MNTDVMVAQIKGDGALPPTALLTESIIVDKMNSELKSIVAMLIESERQEFLTDIQDVQLLSTQSAYPFPERALASTARVLKFVDSSGAEDPKPLRELALAEVGDYAFITGDPIGFFVTATDFNPLPRPGTATSGKIRVYYPRRPSTLVQDLLNGSSQHTQVGTISGITVAGGNTTITLAAAHSGFPAGNTIDLQSAKSPYKLLAKDVVVTTAAVGTATITCNGVDLTGIGWAVGDYVTLAKTSYIPLLPEEAHDMLRDFAIARCLNDINQKERAASFAGIAKGRFSLFLKVTAPRLGQNTKAISAWKGWRRRAVR